MTRVIYGRLSYYTNRNLYDDPDTITLEQLFAKLQHQLGDRLVTFDIVGCASLLCFRDHMSEHLQLVKVDDIETTMMGNIFSDGQVSGFLSMS